jgi:hypothetical protein
LYCRGMALKLPLVRSGVATLFLNNESPTQK